MRRPRGPGGRFLTAEEIAAGKTGTSAAAKDEQSKSPIDPPQQQTTMVVPTTPAFPPMPQKPPTATDPHNLFLQKPTMTSGPHLSGPYLSMPMRMHHIPHPHAHARIHHAHMNYLDGIYPQAVSSSGSPFGSAS